MYNFLEGVRVIELGHILLGPFTGQCLGDFGADVIKVEAVTGDFYRLVGAGRNPGMGGPWMNCNRNKRSISINLKTAEGKEVLNELLQSADVLIHNMRPMAMNKLGFSYENVKAINPRILYCFSSGFGQDGPYRDYPAFDDVIQAYSGIASLNGHVEGKPRLLPVAVTDTLTGLTLANAILAGLYRQKGTGEGCCIEVPMFESTVAIIMNQHLNGHVFNPPVGTMGYKRVLSPDRKPCQTLDGFVVHGVYTFPHWQRFLAAVGRLDIRDSDLLADEGQLASNISDLYRIVSEEIMPTKTTADWLALFDQLDIPCAPVKPFETLDQDAHLQAVGLFEDYEHPTEGSVRQVRTPVTVTGIDKQQDKHPPVLGEHSVNVLRDVKFDERRIQALLDCGAVCQATPHSESAEVE